jgi:hypothetical protein
MPHLSLITWKDNNKQKENSMALSPQANYTDWDNGKDNNSDIIFRIRSVLLPVQFITNSKHTHCKRGLHCKIWGSQDGDYE